MESQKLVSRTAFFRITAGLSLGLITWVWWQITRFQISKETRTSFRHGPAIPQGISFFGNYYIYRNGNSLRAFSTTCTHAGCRIGQSHGERLLCSCHGSQFDGPTGKPVRGPAFKPLRELECTFEQDSEQWIVSYKKNSNGII